MIRILHSVKVLLVGLLSPIWHSVRSAFLYPHVRMGYDCIIDSSCTFEGGNLLHNKIVLSRSSLGRGTYVCSYSVIRNAQIGRYCSIADGVHIGLARHQLSTISSHPLLEGQNPPIERITIGSDVWIGAGAMLVGNGISVGDGAVIGAGAVVTKSVPPYAIVGGVPAKVIRYRFTPEEISILMENAWWNWSVEKINSEKDAFLHKGEFLIRFHS